MSDKSATRTRMVITGTILLAVLVGYLAFLQGEQESFRFLTLRNVIVLVAMFAFVILMDCVQTTIRRMQYATYFTVSGAVFVAASVGYGAIAGMLVAALGTLITEVVARREPRKLIFNVAQLGCTAGIAGLTYHALAGDGTGVPLSSLRTTVAAIIAAVLYLLINPALFSLVVGAAIGKSPIAIFIATVPGFFLQNISLQAIGLLLTTVRVLTPWSFVIVLLPLLGPYLAMRGQRETLIQIQRTIEALADTVDRRDTSTAQHSERVAKYTQQMIDEIGNIAFAEAEAIILAARVHDLGKIAIPDAVLLKPGRLDEGEFWLMRQHPVAGDDILQQLSIYKDSLGVVRHHHEKYDGSGYPDGLKGEEIPLGARIVAVADSYDVMTSDRPYARARSIREAKEELLRCKGTHFDPKIVDAFVRILDRQYGAAPAEVRVPTGTAVTTAAG